MITEEARHPERTDDEEYLIRRSQTDPAAFKPLYEKYFRKIFLFILHRVDDKSLSADITSQVFLKALTNLKKFQFRGVPFSAWLFRIALNECNDFFRKKKRYRLVTIEEVAVEELHDELTVDTGLQDLWKKLPFILEKLNTGELHLIELRYFEQRPFKEVADILGISETYAKVRTYRTLEKMKRLFLEQQ